MPQDQQNHQQGQGTPSPLSPTPSPAGSVGSVGSQSSGYLSGELRGNNSNNNAPVVPSTHAQTPGVWVPLPVFNAINKQNLQFTYLLSYQELWDTADSLVIKGKHTGGNCIISYIHFTDLFFLFL